jgi:C1A family cysteine protease
MQRHHKTRKTKRYGCNPDLKDNRDLKFVDSLHYKVMSLPSSVDLRAKLPACWDQGQLGSCTGHGSVGALVFIHPAMMFSRLEAYYNARVIEGDVGQDDGAQIRDVVSGLADTGVVQESVWPYNIDTFATPPANLGTAPACKISQYLRINNLLELKNSLAQGFPVIIGFTVYEGFETDEVAQSGILNMPGVDEQVVGGHCVLVVGYDDANGRALVRNSWGTAWGINGYFWMDYGYFQDLVSDMWTIRS